MPDPGNLSDNLKQDIFMNFACGHFPASIREFDDVLTSAPYKEYFEEVQLKKKLNELKARQDRMTQKFATVAQKFATVEKKRAQVKRMSDSTEAQYQRMHSAVKDYIGACLCAVP